MDVTNYILFRRTLAVAGALALASMAAMPAGAATATLGGASCSHNGLTVDPSGNITINCISSDPVAATISLTGPASMTVGGAAANATITRSGGPTGEAVNVNYSVAGACTATPASGTLTFAAAGSQTVALTPGAAAGTCTIAIATTSPHVTSPSLINITVATASGGGGVPGCPTPQPDYKTVNMGWTGNYEQLRLNSGEIAAFPIPAPKTGSSKVTVRLMQGQQPASPANATSEFYISKCPGVIDETVQYCYKKTIATNFITAPDAYTGPKYSFTSQETVGARGCWAPATEGQWYVNVRWTYQGTCAYGCGYSMQWSEGSY